MIDNTESSPPRGWQTPSQPLALLPQDIHVWKIPLQPPRLWLPKLWAMLNVEEQQRAKRYKTQTLQDTFVTARGTLRLILHRYLHIEAAHIQFASGTHGKPYITEPVTSPPLTFNLSHSAELALLAVAVNRQIGIDIEHNRRTTNYSGMINRICSPQEQLFLKDLPPDEQQKLFLTCWTRKEAYVKALGQGITFSLNTVTVSLDKNEPPEILQVEGQEKESLRWSMRELYPAPDYAAALVGEGQDWNHVCLKWEWDTTLGQDFSITWF